MKPVIIIQTSDVPEGVSAVEAHGSVTGDDCKNVLVPTVQDELTDRDRIRFLNVLGSGSIGFD